MNGWTSDGLHTCGPLPAVVVDWSNIGQLVIAAAVMAALVAVGAYVAGKLRAPPVQKEPLASELLTKFREMHSQGVLSDEEFRTIKTTLTERLQSELKEQEKMQATNPKDPRGQ